MYTEFPCLKIFPLHNFQKRDCLRILAHTLCIGLLLLMDRNTLFTFCSLLYTLYRGTGSVDNGRYLMTHVVNIASVLWRDKGFTVKYSLSTREIPRAEPGGCPGASGYISPYIQTWVIIHTFSMSKSYTSRMSFLVGQYWKSWFSVLVWQLGYIFPYCPVYEALRVHIDPVENSVVAALRNSHGQEINTKRVNF